MSLLLFLVCLVLSCGYALIRGGAPERIAAALMIGAFVAGIPLHLFVSAADYRSLALGGAAIDAVLLLALIVLAWRSTRYWPLWVAAWQVATVLAHTAKLLDPTMQATGYAIQAQIWGYPMVLAAGVGAWRHRQRRKAGFPDPAWKSMVSS